MDEPRGVRPIDKLVAEMDQLGAELRSLSTQVALLLFASLVLSVTVGALLWRRR